MNRLLIMISIIGSAWNQFFIDEKDIAQAQYAVLYPFVRKSPDVSNYIISNTTSERFSLTCQQVITINNIMSLSISYGRISCQAIVIKCQGPIRIENVIFERLNASKNLLIDHANIKELIMRNQSILLENVTTFGMVCIADKIYLKEIIIRQYQATRIEFLQNNYSGLIHLEANSVIVHHLELVECFNVQQSTGNFNLTNIDAKQGEISNFTVSQGLSVDTALLAISTRMRYPTIKHLTVKDHHLIGSTILLTTRFENSNLSDLLVLSDISITSIHMSMHMRDGPSLAQLLPLFSLFRKSEVSRMLLANCIFQKIIEMEIFKVLSLETRFTGIVINGNQFDTIMVYVFHLFGGKVWISNSSMQNNSRNRQQISNSATNLLSMGRMLAEQKLMNMEMNEWTDKERTLCGLLVTATQQYFPYFYIHSNDVIFLSITKIDIFLHSTQFLQFGYFNQPSKSITLYMNGISMGRQNPILPRMDYAGFSLSGLFTRVLVENCYFYQLNLQRSSQFIFQIPALKSSGEYLYIKMSNITMRDMSFSALQQTNSMGFINIISKQLIVVKLIGIQLLNLKIYSYPNYTEQLNHSLECSNYTQIAINVNKNLKDVDYTSLTESSSPNIQGVALIQCLNCMLFISKSILMNIQSLYTQTGLVVQCSSMEVKESLFKAANKNVVTQVSNLGAFINFKGRQLLIDKCVFAESVARMAGAILFTSINQNASLSITNSQFRDLTARGFGDSDGGMLVLRVSERILMTVKGCLIERCSSEKLGAVIHASSLGSHVMQLVDIEMRDIVGYWPGFAVLNLTSKSASKIALEQNLNLVNVSLVQMNLVSNHSGTLLLSTSSRLTIKQLVVDSTASISTVLQPRGTSDINIQFLVLRNLSRFEVLLEISQIGVVRLMDCQLSNLSKSNNWPIIDLSNSVDGQLNRVAVINITGNSSNPSHFLMSSQLNVTISSSLFIYNKDIGFIEATTSSLKISDTLCVLNQAPPNTNGTCLHISNSSVDIMNSRFKHISKSRFGGAIYFKTGIEHLKKLLSGRLVMQEITLNITTYLLIVLDQKCVFEGNQADVGQSIYLEVPWDYYQSSCQMPRSKLRQVMNLPDSAKLFIYQLCSDCENLIGQMYSQSTLNLTIINRVNESKVNFAVSLNTNTQDEQYTAYINLQSNGFRLGPEPISPNETGPIQLFTPDLKQPQQIQVDILGTLIDNHNFRNVTFTIRFEFRDCVASEVVYRKGCQVCPENTYSLHYHPKAVCYQCPEGSICKKGIILLNDGYWRIDNRSDLIEACIVGSSCHGDNPQAHCSPYYIGPLCATCDIMGTQGIVVHRYRSNQCEECEYQVEAMLQFWFNVGFAAAVVALQMFLTYKGILNQLVMRYLELSGLLFFGKSGKVNPSIFIKLMCNHAFVLYTIHSFQVNTDISWFFSFFNTMGNQSELISYSFDCVYQYLQEWFFSHAYLDLIQTQLQPLTIAILATIVYFGFVLCRLADFQYRILQFIVFYSYWITLPIISAKIFACLSCRDIAQLNYMWGDLTVNCYGDHHSQWVLQLALPALLLNTLIIPISVLMWIRSQQLKLSTPKVQPVWGLLYKEYRKTAYYFEFFKLYEKLLIILLVNVLNDVQDTKGLVIILVLLLYTLTSHQIKPYLIHFITVIDGYSNLLLLLSMALVLMIIEMEDHYPALALIMWGAICSINLGFSSYLCWKVVHQYTRRFRSQLIIIYKGLSQDWPIVTKFCHISLVSTWDTLYRWKLLRTYVMIEFSRDPNLPYQRIRVLERKVYDYIEHDKTMTVVNQLDASFHSDSQAIFNYDV